ncbi:Lysine exporter protein LYSE/YGGA [Thermoproteus uzoniensis 768-20]|uniref:Lysine exporter protein LYSE/YGGA n=1 Tax=Thermoproteus uzoniensis (strain 768-20) TaxID=999630 RepID=F2L1P4_THEU7|nr:LysE family transporter [Thermoproteus uzoniensis]AEA12900.1 Lysine exporter protein LYSE/YGGA [Thermoproteus uzoniensis 768-20]
MSQAFAQIAAGLVLGYSLAVPPGPMNALIASWALKGFRHGVAVGAGAMTADFIFMLLTLLLYEEVLAAVSSRYVAVIYLAGSFFLLYIAYKIALSKPPDAGARGASERAVKGYLLGLSLGLANPYQLGWWLTVGLSSISSFGLYWALGLFSAIAAWITSFPAAVRAGWRLNSRGTWLAIKAFSVTTLAAFGGYFVFLSVKTLI